MRQLLTIALLLCANAFPMFSQNNDFLTKRIPITTKDDLRHEPLIMKGNKGEIILLYLKSVEGFKQPNFFVVVLDDKLNKIYEKEIPIERSFFGSLGAMRNKSYLSMDRVQFVDYGDEVGVFYERSTDLAYFTLSKKDYSLKKNNDVELDSKVQITTFSRDRSIIKAFPYKDKLYALYAGKEDNQLTVATISKGGKVEYKMLNVPQIKLDKGNGKSKDLEFMKYDEFDTENDSLFTFIFETKNESKYFHTIVLNVEQMKARVMKYTFPSIANNKDGEIYRGVYMLNDKVFLSSVNAEKCVVSIKNKSTGEEIKSMSFNNGGKVPYQNTDILDKESHFSVTGAQNPMNVKMETANTEKFWKRFSKGGNDGNIGIVMVEPLDTFYRISMGYKDSRFISYTYRNIRSIPGSGLTNTTSTTSNSITKQSSTFYGYFDNKLEHMPNRKKSAFEDAIEKVELRNGPIKPQSTAMKMYRNANVSYFIYFDDKTNEIVLLGSKK